jgi:hypothetical protein
MSTYSPSLRIELITNGTQAGTWGDTTNNNLAYILDSSIAGYQLVTTTSSSQALTYTSGPTATIANNQSVYAMLKFETTTGAAFKVFAPPVSKMYVVWNNSIYPMTIYNSTAIGNTTAAGSGTSVTSGVYYTVISLSGTTLVQWQALFSGISTLPSVGQTFVATATGTLAGGATVAATTQVSAGDKVLVWSDGTTFYDIKSAGVSTTVAIANGGTGQTTANAAFNALAPSQTSAYGKYLQSDGTNTSWDAITLTSSASASVVSGVIYTVAALGGSNLGQWQALFSGLSALPSVGQVITATATGTIAGGGTVTFSDVSGILGLANGGTGVTTAQAAMNAFAGAVTSGSYLRGNGTNVVMNTIQAADVPTLNQNTTGTANNVTGIVAVANGGTGLATLTANNVLLGNGTSTPQAVAPGTSGNLLTSNGTTWVSAAPVAPDVQTIASTSTWTKPTGGQTMARIMVWGGGGGGAGYDGAGGSGGGYNEQTVPLSYLASSVTVTIGAGGGGGSSGGGAGGNGGQSSFPLSTSFNGVSSVAAGGGYGGGVGTGSQTPYIFAGASASSASYGGYAGGAGYGPYSSSGSAWGGAGGGQGLAGTAPGGGGGGGATAAAGGAGAIGRVVVMCW